MKSQIKITTKLLLILSLTLLTNCEKDDLETQETTKTSSPNFRITTLEEDNYKNNLKLVTSLSKFKGKQKENQSLRQEYNSVYDFTVNTDEVKFIESNDTTLHSYTFEVIPEENSTAFENLVFTLQNDGTYLTEFVQYNTLDNGDIEVKSATLDSVQISNYNQRSGADFNWKAPTLMSASHMNNGAAGRWVMVTLTTYNINCTNPGNCDTNTGGCDLCYLCVSTTSSNQYVWVEENTDVNISEDEAGGPSNGGSNGNTNATTDPDPSDPVTLTSPVIPDYSKPVVDCINGLGQTDNVSLTPEMVTWLQLENDKGLNLELGGFLDENSCSVEAQEFAVDFINANLNSPFEVNLFEFAPDDNITTPDNKKFMCIYNKLANSPSFKNLFIDTFNESTDMHITFALSDSFQDSQSAVTSPDTINSASHQTITLNANHLNTKHPLTIAQTIIHEALHAFLNYKQSDGVCNPNNDGPSIYELESLTLGELLNDFNYNCIENATNDHNLMFNLLIPVMEQQLNEVFNDLVAPEDLNPTQFFYPPPNNSQHSFTWENAIYYMSLVGLGEANSFTTTTNEIPNQETSSDLFEQYNIRINSNAFNKLTCEE